MQEAETTLGSLSGLQGHQAWTCSCIGIGTHRHTHRHTRTQTHTVTNMHRCTHPDKHTDTDTQTQRPRNTQTHVCTDTCRHIIIRTDADTHTQLAPAGGCGLSLSASSTGGQDFCFSLQGFPPLWRAQRCADTSVCVFNPGL